MVNLRPLLAAFEGGRLDEAETLARQILSLAPGHAQAALVLGNVLLRRGLTNDAERILATGIVASPGSAELLHLHGVVLAQLGRVDEAINRIDQALERKINFPAAHQSLSALLAKRNDPTPRFSLCVVTASVGNKLLKNAIESVQAQTYPLLEHLVVADGPKYHDRVRALLPAESRYPIRFLPLPLNIGAGGYCGHRIYGAAPYLINSRFVAFLDEDNTFDNDHFSSLMKRITAEGLAWAYSLRKIYDQQGNYITNDDCESLGQWPTWNNPNVHLVDVSCYVLRRDLAIATSSLWYRRAPTDENPDFALCMHLLREKHPCGTNGRYTVNYRAGAEDGRSVQVPFFLTGNKIMRDRFGSSFPWNAISASDS